MFLKDNEKIGGPLKQYANGYVFFGCHMDDVEYGCGATIHRLSQRKKPVVVVTLTDHNEASDGRVQLVRDKEEHYRAICSLGMERQQSIIGSFPGQVLSEHRQKLREYLLCLESVLKPKYVFFPSKNDIHQDHQVLHEEAFRIFRNINCFGYEIIRSTIDFTPNYFSVVTQENVNAKLESVLQYSSQSQQSAAYYFSGKILESILIFRGTQVNVSYAEAFEAYRFVTDQDMF